MLLTRAIVGTLADSHRPAEHHQHVHEPTCDDCNALRVEHVRKYHTVASSITATMAFQSPRHSQSFYPNDAATPPPPPPKPGNSSGTATPSTGPPLPPPPGQSQPHGSSQLAYSQHGPQVDPYQPAIQPPNDGWLPVFVKDKGYTRP